MPGDLIASFCPSFGTAFDPAFHPAHPAFDPANGPAYPAFDPAFHPAFRHVRHLIRHLIRHVRYCVRHSIRHSHFSFSECFAVFTFCFLCSHCVSSWTRDVLCSAGLGTGGWERSRAIGLASAGGIAQDGLGGALERSGERADAGSIGGELGFAGRGLRVRLGQRGAADLLDAS